jgi:ferredoxin
MKVKVDTSKCVASGQCSALVPRVFGWREEDGKVTLLDEAPEAELHDAVRDAETLCPAAAIILTES